MHVQRKTLHADKGLQFGQNKMWSVFLSIILCCIFARSEGTDCDPVTGPAGGFACALPPISEWHMCISDEYLQILTHGSYGCSNPYCFLHCSVEDQYTSNDCFCSEEDTFPSQPSLPSWCFNPPGKTCSWYRACLNVKKPCVHSEYDYAIPFGEHFCNAYEKTYHSFSSQGQEWVDAVRRCLQVKLVYVLRPWGSFSCKQIKMEAFKSHAGCYLSPVPGAPSFCSLGPLDWWRSFWTIKDAFSSESYQSIKGFLELALDCVDLFVSELPRGDMRRYSAVVTLGVAPDDADTSVTDELDTFAQGVADKIAKKLEWDSSTLDWYAYTEVSAQARRSSNATQLILLIGDKVALGMVQANDTSPPTNLEETVTQLTTAAESGYLDDIVKIESLEACSDLKCDDRYIHVDMDKPSDDSSAKKTSIDFLVWIFGLTAVLLI